MNFIERLTEFFNRCSNFGYLFTVILTALIIAVAYIYVFMFLLKNNSVYVIFVFVAVSVLFGLMLILNQKDGFLFLLIPLLFLLGIMVLFSVEIKRLVWARDKTKSVFSAENYVYNKEKVDKCIAEIIKALQDMSKNDIGAIIVFANNNIPKQILDSGVVLQAEISSQLIESVFFPKTPLHDGAMIIDGTNIVASGCFLPLSQNIDKIPKDLGTRHRAGIGITENIDVLSIIVSEETGIISIVKAGNITRYADAEMLRKELVKYYWQDEYRG